MSFFAPLQARATCDNTTRGNVDKLVDAVAEATRAGHILYVLCYAPWCGHCKSCQPPFDEAAQEVAKHPGNPATLISFDWPTVMANKETAAMKSIFGAHIEVPGYPIFLCKYPNQLFKPDNRTRLGTAADWLLRVYADAKELKELRKAA